MSSDNRGQKEEQSVTHSTARPRRSTLETFNEELAVLDRPIEGDVEYYDEIPPVRRFRLLPVAAAVFTVAGGALLAVSGHRARAPIEAGAVSASMPLVSVSTSISKSHGVPAIVPIAASAVPSAASAVPSATSAVPGGTAATPPPTESPAQTDEVPARTSSPATSAVWAKSLHRAGHPKHGRSTGTRSSGRSGRRRG